MALRSVPWLLVLACLLAAAVVPGKAQSTTVTFSGIYFNIRCNIRPDTIQLGTSNPLTAAFAQTNKYTCSFTNPGNAPQPMFNPRLSCTNFSPIRTDDIITNGCVLETGRIERGETVTFTFWQLVADNPPTLLANNNPFPRLAPPDGLRINNAEPVTVACTSVGDLASTGAWLTARYRCTITNSLPNQVPLRMNLNCTNILLTRVENVNADCTFPYNLGFSGSGREKASFSFTMLVGLIPPVGSTLPPPPSIGPVIFTAYP